MLDGQTQSARPGWPHHEPVMITRKMFVGNLLRELAVIDLVILPADALLGHAGGAAGLENVEWLAFECLGHPDVRLQIPQPFILEMWKAEEVGKPLHFLCWVPVRLFGPVEPEG